MFCTFAIHKSPGDKPPSHNPRPMRYPRNTGGHWPLWQTQIPMFLLGKSQLIAEINSPEAHRRWSNIFVQDRTTRIIIWTMNQCWWIQILQHLSCCGSCGVCQVRFEPAGYCLVQTHRGSGSDWPVAWVPERQVWRVDLMVRIGNGSSR
jgi:hypothetical protein